MSKLSLREIAQSQLDSTPVIDGQLIVCLDTGNAYRDTATAHVKIGSDLEVVSDLPLAPLAEKLYYLKPDKLYVFLGGNWTLLNDKTIDLDESIAKLPAGTATDLNDDVEIITQDTDFTQPHYYRRKLVVLWEYIKAKAQNFFAAKDHKHKKADITDFPTSMPASDVHPWAKEATKPSYTKAEVGLGKVDNTADADKTVKRATTAGTADTANSVTWENVKDKPTTFPVEAHNHDDRYYTEAEVNSKLNGKVDNTETGANGLLSKLSVWTATPTDDTYFMRQDTDGTNQFGRVKFSTIWNYIKSKADGTYQPKGSYAASDHNHDERYYTEAEVDGKLSSHTHYSISTIADNRNTNTTPDDYKNTLIFQGLKFNDKIGSPSSNLFSYLLGLRGWADASGGDSHELAFNNTGVYWRHGASEWSGWSRIYGENYHPNADYATTTGSANALSGLSSRSGQNWGVQTGTFVHGEGDSTGGDFAFRRDCPNAGQMSMVIDGRFYQNEGNYRVLDTSDEPNLNVNSANYINDVGDRRTLSFAYSKDGLAYGSYSWLAGWNGNELRAVDKNQFATAGHTHDMSTLTGNVINTEPGTSNHKVVLGKPGLDKCEFYEYGGIWNFYKMNPSQSLVASIQPDGIHAALKGTADVANVANFAKETYISQYKTVNLTDLDQNTWYPVTGNNFPYNGLRHFKCNVQLNSGSKPNWSTHSAGFTAVVDILEEASGWGTTTMLGEVLINDQRFIADGGNPPVGYGQMSYSSIPVWWLRGGGSYRLAADYDITWTIQKSTYTSNGQSVSPTTTYPGVNVNRSTIVANLNGNASTSDIATTGVRDYNASSRTIRIGYSGAGLTRDNLTHIAGYTEDGTKIKDVSKDVLSSWLGLGNYLPIAGGTMAGALNFKNGTWNLVGDDAYMGDHNINGSFCIMGANDTTRLALVNKDNQGDYALVEYGGGNLNFNKKLGANITGHADGDLALSGGTLTGDIAFSNCGTGTRQILFTCADNDYGRIAVGGTASNAGYMEIATADDGTEPIYVRQYSGIYASIVRSATLLDGSGNTTFPGAVTANTYYAPNWFRATGNSGFCFENHGGGWYMTDDTWIRAFNSKNIYTPGVIQCDSGFNGNLNGKATSAGTADSATTSNGVKDYNDGNRTIQIGYAGAGLNTSNLTHIAGYTDNGTKIKDVSKDVLTSWIGLGNYLPLSGGVVTGQIKKDTGGSWIGDRDRVLARSHYPGDWSYGAVAGMPTKNGFWTMGALGGWEDLVFNYSTDSNYSAGNNSTSQVRLPAQAGTIITSATIGNQTVNRAEYLGNDAAYMRMHWNGQSGQPTWLWGGNDASNMYVYNPSNFSVNYANNAGNGTADFQTKVTDDGQFGAVRFNNGVQICWFTMKNTRNKTFLLPFADTNYAIAFSGGYCWLDVDSRTTTGFTTGAQWSGYENSYIAIGRWK